MPDWEKVLGYVTLPNGDETPLYDWLGVGHNPDGSPKAVPSLHLVRHVDYARGSDTNNGLSPHASFKTIQAAYDDLVAVATANYTALTSQLGVGRIQLGPGDHDVGTGLIIDQRWPVEIVGTRSGWGNWTARNSSTRIYSSSAAAVQLILTGSTTAVTQGNRFVDLCFIPNTSVNTALTACIRTQANTHLWIERCAFETFDHATTWSGYAIEMHPGVSAQDNAWHRIVGCACARMPFYKAVTGSNFNRSLIGWNAVAYTGALAAVHFQGDWLGGTVIANSIEGACPAFVLDAGLADSNVFLGNSGEQNDANLYPYYDVNSSADGNIFIGGFCTNPGQTGTWIDFASTTAQNVVINPNVTIAGTSGYKRKFTDNTAKKSNFLFAQYGLAPKLTEGAGKTALVDSDWHVTPENGAWGFVRNTSDDVLRLSVRANGTWRQVALA